MRKLIFILALLLLFSLPTFGGTFVQVKGAGTSSSGTTVSATFDNPTITGNLIFTACFSRDQNRDFTVADGGTNTFTQVRQTKWNNAYGDSTLWSGRVENATGKASHQITCTASGASNRLVIVIAEYSGVLTSSALDKNAGTTGTSTSASSGNTATTTQATELLIGVVGGPAPIGGPSPSVAAGTSYTLRLKSTATDDASYLAVEDRNVTSTGAYAGTFTLGTSPIWAAHVVTFKDAAAARRNKSKVVN